MKQYAILTSPENNPIVISTNSHDYAELMQLGYSVAYAGNKKECERVFSEQFEMELSY